MVLQVAPRVSRHANAEVGTRHALLPLVACLPTGSPFSAGLGTEWDAELTGSSPSHCRITV